MLDRTSLLAVHAMCVTVVVAVLGPAPVAAQPKLAVVIVVDQMRAGFLTEFAEDFDGGLARLTRDGAVFTGAFHDHALTATAPGHATIATGTYPSRHGVIGNQIWSYELDRLRNIVLDANVATVGMERRSGRSPHTLMRSGLGDWLKAQSPDSKVFAVSLKDRAAVFAGGQQPDAVYWYDNLAGNFVTADYYVGALPAWVERFNELDWVDPYFGEAWVPSFDDGHDRLAHVGVDGASFSEFPHVLVGDAETPDRRFYSRFRLTPFADRMTLDFAEALIDAEQLGTDDTPDVLFIGLSAADYIGHRYGPWSEETHDHYARLDQYLGEFLAFLDDRVGRDRYTLALTADHGVMPIPEQMASLGLKAGRTLAEDVLADLEPVVRAAVERGVVPVMPRLGYIFGVVFDFDDADVSARQIDALATIVAEHLRARPDVASAYTTAELQAESGMHDPWLGRHQRSFYPGRAPAVTVNAIENHLITPEERGATHGSPYAYDARVPLIFLGDGIAPGEYRGDVRTVDIAPTLATLLGIEPPDDLDGHDVSAKFTSVD
jgi:predicted AlkP superfamily pyrophosphatase or phosphodiesterase